MKTIIEELLGKNVENKVKLKEKILENLDKIDKGKFDEIDLPIGTLKRFARSEFYKQKYKLAKREYYEKNREKVNEYQRKYYEKNKEKNREKVNEYQRKYYEKNREKMNEYQREYHQKNRELLKRYKAILLERGLIEQ